MNWWKHFRGSLRYLLFLLGAGWLAYSYLVFNGSVRDKVALLFVSFIMLVIFSVMFDVDLNPRHWFQDRNEK